MVYDPLAGTDLALAAVPDTMTGFGVAELASLLALQDGAVVDRSRELLGISADYADDAIKLAGFSALTVRGLLSADDNGYQPRSSALLLSVALAQATRWTRLAILDQGAPEAAFFVQSPTVDALIEPSLMVSWWAAFQDPDPSAAELLARLVQDRLGRSQDKAVVMDFQELNGSVGNLLMRPSASGFDVIADVDRDGEGGRSIELGAGGLPALLAGYLAVSGEA